MATKKKSTKKAAKPKIEEKAEVQPAEQVMEAKPIPDEAEMQEKFAAAIDELLDPGNGKNEVPAISVTKSEDWGIPLKSVFTYAEISEMADQIEWGLRTAKITRPHKGYDMADKLRRLAG